jgi:hypothetical protein
MSLGTWKPATSSSTSVATAHAATQRRMGGHTTATVAASRTARNVCPLGQED